MNLDKSVDIKIRSALKDADLKGKLSVVAAVVGTDEKHLKEILENEDELSIMDRGMLGIHLQLT